VGQIALANPKDDGIYTERDLVLVERLASVYALALQRQRAEAQIAAYAADLERSNAELEQFAYVISHDLQAPARAVKGFLNLLQERHGDELAPQAAAYVDHAVEGADRMAQMIDALLALSRVERHGQDPAPTDAAAVLDQALAILAPALDEAGAEVTHDPLPTVMADAVQLAQVFQNLIANAVKFRREGAPPRVHVAAEPEGRMWAFSVADNGIGIDPEQVDRLFRIFQRLHTQEEYEGLGIGLALCRRIVTRHGGRIWVTSKPDVGSTFYFTLPAVQDGTGL
jgi:light-regulated signal transduction histidine kinase (bacteriophytochrome)